MLARLGHRAVSGGHHQNRSVHLRRAGNHVLDVVGVTGAVHVRVVPRRRLVLDVGGVDRDTARFFFRRGVNGFIRHRLRSPALRQNRRNRRCQARLAVVHVTDCPDVHMGLVTVKCCLTHNYSIFPSVSKTGIPLSR